MPHYRPLLEEELNRALFAKFIRRQSVCTCWRRIDGRWQLRDDPFIDDWSEEDYALLLRCLKNTLSTGGFVYGGFCGEELKGFVSVEVGLFGGQQGYLDLSSLHVSADQRGKGMGRELFQAARQWAADHGGRKLYISSHSAAETQAFYRSLGCVDAQLPHPGHVAAEPYDCQLECNLSPAPAANPAIRLRPYQPEDCPQLAQLFYETVHSINARSYTPEQLDAWADGQVDLPQWNQTFLTHRTLVALDSSTIAGFADMDEEGYFDRLFVHRDYQRRGIATALCDALESAAPARITTHASITARPFFESRGYRVIRQQQVLRKGVLLTNYTMEKQK